MSVCYGTKLACISTNQWSLAILRGREGGRGVGEGGGGKRGRGGEREGERESSIQNGGRIQHESTAGVLLETHNYTEGMVFLVSGDCLKLSRQKF